MSSESPVRSLTVVTVSLGRWRPVQETLLKLKWERKEPIREEGRGEDASGGTVQKNSEEIGGCLVAALLSSPSCVDFMNVLRSSGLS